MIVLRILVFLLAMFSGTVFSLFVLTAIEAKSKGFQNLIGRIHNLLPKGVWTFLVLFSILAFGLLSYSIIADYARAGIVAGLFVGVFVCLRAGPNINYRDMEKAAEEFDKEQAEKKNRRMNGGRKKYVGAAPKSAKKTKTPAPSKKSGKPKRLK